MRRLAGENLRDRSTTRALDATLLRRLFNPRRDRVRGTGWLDCPNCHEHASQDVDDEMRFAALLTYRLTPITRKRVLVCRRCGYRRPATDEELRRLETGGQPIRRAWLVPIGLLPIVAVLVLTLVVSNHNTAADTGESYKSVDARPVADIGFQLPVEWNHETDVDSSPDIFTYTASDAGGRFQMRIRRFNIRVAITDLIGHYRDDTGINSGGLPLKVPTTSSTKVADQDAQKLSFDYTETGDPTEITMYAFLHDGVGYTITFRAAGKDTIASYHVIADHIVPTFTFAKSETPPPPTPGASPSPSPSPTPSPTPKK